MLPPCEEAKKYLTNGGGRELYLLGLFIKAELNPLLRPVPIEPDEPVFN